MRILAGDNSSHFQTRTNETSCERILNKLKGYNPGYNTKTNAALRAKAKESATTEAIASAMDARDVKAALIDVLVTARTVDATPLHVAS